MKKPSNLNKIKADIFVAELAEAGVDYAVLCPGSRNTPLIYAFEEEKRIEKISVIDERSAGYFALGISLATGKPAVVVTTSGTAVAELYPAVIEAYQKRTPLIVCTADRPDYLHDCGANQTIDQENIFKKYTAWYWEAQLTEPNLGQLIDIKRSAAKAVVKAELKPGGPVHINFPFEKPLEPWRFNGEVDEEVLKQLEIYSPKILSYNRPEIGKYSKIKSLIELIVKHRRGVILANSGRGLGDLSRQIVLLSELTGYPIFAEGISQLRFGLHEKKNVLSNASAFVHSEALRREADPEIIIQFGDAPLTNTLLKFYKESKAVKVLINKEGALKDPSKTTDLVVEAAPSYCIEKIISGLEEYSFAPDENWTGKLSRVDAEAGKVRKSFLNRERFPSESRVIRELMAELPDGCNLMISNSMPVRDWELFAAESEKDIRIFTNRGTSGIDGIISTALGIANASDEPTFLLTGDLAFYHNISALQIATTNDLRLKIVLINNNGGGIFEMLPVANERKYFVKRFATPHGLNFGKIVKAFDCAYFAPKSWDEFRIHFSKLTKIKKSAVLELQTDARKQAQRRKKYYQSVVKAVDKVL